jgi:hypothetical protein
MVRMRGVLLGVTMLSAVIGPVMAEDCLTFDTTATLQGKITAVEDYWVLQVSPAMCVDLPPGDDLGAPAHNVQEVQLVLKDPATAQKFAGQTVSVSGHLSPPHGEAGKRPVVLEVGTLKKK